MSKFPSFCTWPCKWLFTASETPAFIGFRGGYDVGEITYAIYMTYKKSSRQRGQVQEDKNGS
eukprot:1157459-Pelagomonas_calceolata.AAC.3